MQILRLELVGHGNMVNLELHTTTFLFLANHLPALILAFIIQFIHKRFCKIQLLGCKQILEIFKICFVFKSIKNAELNSAFFIQNTRLKQKNDQ